jgi:glycosyltransferase involved in cell wall biosynthesis
MDGVARELVHDGQEGVIVDSEDPREWALHITELLGAPARLRQMGAHARCSALARASMDAALDRYATFFRRIARPRG